jgi:hypothetical protein
MKGPLVPSDFPVPDGLVTRDLILRPLTVHDVVKDYDAVMTSIAHLRGVFGPDSAWPSPDLTLEQDLIDLGWHQKEFQQRSSFAYTVMTPDESRCLGCVYIYPSADQELDAVVYLWVRASAFDQGLDPILYEAVRGWVAGAWPFTRVAYPGRN